jgi:hypothetical protein
MKGISMNKFVAFILSLFGIKEQAKSTAETVEVEAPKAPAKVAKAPVVKKVSRYRGRPAPRGGAILLASNCRGLLVKRMH